MMTVLVFGGGSGATSDVHPEAKKPGLPAVYLNPKALNP